MGGLDLVPMAWRNYLSVKLSKKMQSAEDHKDFQELCTLVMMFNETNVSGENDLKQFAVRFLECFKSTYLSGYDMKISYKRFGQNCVTTDPSAATLADYSTSSGLVISLEIPIRYTSKKGLSQKDNSQLISNGPPTHHRIPLNFTIRFEPGIGGAYVSSDELCFGAHIEIENEEFIRELCLDIGDRLYNFAQITVVSTYATTNRHRKYGMLDISE